MRKIDEVLLTIYINLLLLLIFAMGYADCLILDTAIIKITEQKFNTNNQIFQTKLEELSTFINFYETNNQSTIQQNFKKFIKAYQTDKNSEINRIQQHFSSIVKLINQIVASAANIININFYKNYQYIFQTISLMNNNHQLSKQKYPYTFPQEIHEKINIKTNHKKKYYQNYFSPTEISVQCVTANQKYIFSGGWDGFISLFSNTTSPQQIIIAPISEFPVMKLKVIDNCLFVLDKLNTLIISFIKQNKLEIYKKFVQIGNNFIVTDDNLLSSDCKILGLNNQGKIQSFDFKYSQNLDKREILQSSYSSKFIQLSKEDLLLMDDNNNQLYAYNIKQKIRSEIKNNTALKIFKQIDQIGVFKNSSLYVNFVSEKSLFLTQLINSQLQTVIQFHFDEKITISSISQRTFIFAVGSKLYRFDQENKKIVYIGEQPEQEYFELGITDIISSQQKIILSGSDNNSQLKIILFK